MLRRPTILIKAYNLRRRLAKDAIKRLTLCP
jgi:hypothetical protein